MKTIHRIYFGILLVLVCFFFSVNPSISQSTGVSKEPPYNSVKDAEEIEKWRKEQYEKLRKEGKATSEGFKRVDNEALNKARNLEHKRQKAVKEIFEKAGVRMPAQTGTTPGAKESRGILGDTDFASLPPRERDKVLKSAKDLGYNIKPQGDSFTIKELDSTVHREGYKRKSGTIQQSEQVGRSAGKETASSFGGTDPKTGKPITTDKHINTMDNIKKGGHTLTKDPGKMTNSDWAEMGKMTSRNIRNGGVQNADVLKKAEMLKQGYSPEAAGIVPDNATPSQREKALKEYQQQCKDANRQAYSNTKKIEGIRGKRLESVVKGREKNLTEAIKNGNNDEINKAREKLKDSREGLSKHRNRQHAAKESVNINQGESVIKEMEKTQGTGKQGDTKGQVKGKPTISEPEGQIKGKEKVKNPIKENLTIKKVGGLIIFGDAVYEGYKRRMEEDPKRSKLDAAGSAAIEATGIPAIHTIATKTGKEYKGEPGKAAIATAYRVIKGAIVGGVEYTADKAKKIPEAHKEFVEKRIAEMEANRIEKASKAERENQKKYIYDKLIKEGASSVGASKAVEALEKGDSKPLHTLRENLKVKKELKETAEKEKLEKENAAKEKAEKETYKKEKAEEKRRAEKESKESVEKERPRVEAEKKLTEGKEEKPQKEWEKMTPEERRDALKSNDPKAWEKVKESLEGNLKSGKEVIDAIDSKPTPPGNADKISDLRGSEAKTSKIDKEKLEKSPEGQKAGMELAQNTKVTDSYDKDRSRKSKQKTKEVQDTAGSTQKERGDVSQAEDQREKTKIKGQGEQTDRAISTSQQEHISAEKAAEQARQTGIGTVIAGGLFGGLSSGVAIGLDNLFGTIGKGAGQQVSSNMSIQPKPSSTVAGNQATGVTTSAAGDPLPWTYSGTCNGTVKAKANFGAGGSVSCSYSGPAKITLNADGSVTGESSAGFYVEFSDSGSGTGCASNSHNSTFSGSHSNGSANITNSSGSKLSGSYNANSLNISGGRSGSSMSLGGGNSATADVSTSCTYSR